MKKSKLYLDDVRTTIQDDWIVVRTFEEFVEKVNEIGLDGFSAISLDHDLGEGAMRELFNSPNGVINYDNIHEKTGMDAAKYLVELSMDSGIPLPQICVHSFNPNGGDNIKSYINNYLRVCDLPETCFKVVIPHRLEKPYPLT